MVQKYLDLSTAHVSKETGEWLDNSPAEVIMYYKGEYGWIVYAASEDLEDRNIPADLTQVINYAKSIDCTWIMFDRDGWTTNYLPVYEW